MSKLIFALILLIVTIAKGYYVPQLNPFGKHHILQGVLLMNSAHDAYSSGSRKQDYIVRHTHLRQQLLLF